MKSYFEYVGPDSENQAGTASKFWEVEQVDADLNVRWGRIGTQGQSQTKSFADAAKAALALTKTSGTTVLLADAPFVASVDVMGGAKSFIGRQFPRAEEGRSAVMAVAAGKQVDVGVRQPHTSSLTSRLSRREPHTAPASTRPCPSISLVAE